MKYKLCPLCGFKCTNLKLVRCPECKKGNLPSIIKDDEINNAPQQTPAEESNELIRICDNCGTKNKSNARKCTSCNEDISDIKPTPCIESIPGSAGYELVSIDGKFQFDITKPLYIIGRNNEFSEYLSLKSFVSGIHAKITLLNNLVYLTDTGSTNGTYVNNKKIEKNIPVLLNDGDVIGLGGNKSGGNYQEKAAYFNFRRKP
jgi:hypothetical protein